MYLHLAIAFMAYAASSSSSEFAEITVDDAGNVVIRSAINASTLIDDKSITALFAEVSNMKASLSDAVETIKEQSALMSAQVSMNVALQSRASSAEACATTGPFVTHSFILSFFSYHFDLRELCLEIFGRGNHWGT
eukprot:m.46345 g.46345  ORF g.46345 m.46345 type:complete len:136 (-) comp47389_c0_seq16:1212-1619(-)